MTSYMGVSGSGVGDGYAPDSIGVFGCTEYSLALNVSVQQITDGISYTLMVGELPPNPDNSSYWWAADWCAQYALGWGVEYDTPPLIDTIQLPPGAAPCPQPAFFSPGDLTNYCNANHFWSFHSGGGNWLLCDGSVRFMAYSAGTTVIPPMATIAGGEVIPAFDD